MTVNAGKQLSREGVCDFPECGRPISARRLCDRHYRMHLKGEPLRPLKKTSPRGTGDVVDGRKFCTKCETWKSVEEYHVSRSQPSGLHAWCRECAKARQREYRQNNPEAVRESNRRWREQNPDWAAERKAKMPPCGFPSCTYSSVAKGLCSGHYKQLARGDVLRPLRAKAAKGVRQTVDGRVCTMCDTWKPADDFYRSGKASNGIQARCIECAKIYGRESYLRNRKAIAERRKLWRAENRDKVRALARRSAAVRRARKIGATIVPFTREQLAARWSYYGNRCWLCAAPATQTDHVKPLAKGGAHTLSNMRPICKDCNNAKWAKWPILALRVVVGINQVWP